jgi:hypothetical protein
LIKVSPHYISLSLEINIKKTDVSLSKKGRIRDCFKHTIKSYIRYKRSALSHHFDFVTISKVIVILINPIRARTQMKGVQVCSSKAGTNF